MSVALVMTGRVCSFLTKYLRRGLIGRRCTPTSFGQASHLAILCRNESEVLGDRKFITNLERIYRGCTEETADRG